MHGLAWMANTPGATLIGGVASVIQRARRMYRPKLNFLAALILLVQMQCEAASFAVECERNETRSVCQAYMSGPIVQGDARRLLNLLQSQVPTDGLVEALTLSSPGGDVEEALKIAAVVRDNFLQTKNYDYRAARAARSRDLQSVGLTEGQCWARDNPYYLKPPCVDSRPATRHECLSACALIFFAGIKREAFGIVQARSQIGELVNSGIGLHRPYFNEAVYREMQPDQLARLQGQVQRRIQDALRGDGVPERLVEAMMRRSSREVMFLSDQDMRDVPDAPPWYEEFMIARCNEDPRRTEKGAGILFEAWKAGVGITRDSPEAQKDRLDQMRATYQGSEAARICLVNARVDAQLRNRRSGQSRQ